MYGTFFLGKNPNGKFFVTNNAANVAQQMADENGTEFYEIVEGKKLSLKECVLESGAEKTVDVEVKTLIVDGQPVKVQTTTQAVKKVERDEAEKNKRVLSASEQESQKLRDKAKKEKPTD